MQTGGSGKQVSGRELSRLFHYRIGQKMYARLRLPFEMRDGRFFVCVFFNQETKMSSARFNRNRLFYKASKVLVA